ncbi:CRISPR-associated protein Csx16 [Niveibacterium sp. COAC-50]|uniref:CRISPR-associated protein Csx16 n=1 Tax=Niveibacterium sp. COAC-50 TaxID=2729384 RepID=UPI001557EF13
MSSTEGRIWIVTRHPGAVEWLQRKGIVVDGLVAHVDPAVLRAGDTVVGILPVQLAARICEAGGRYLHLSLDVPPALRGKELTADEMDALNPRLEEYIVARADTNARLNILARSI